MMVQVGPCSWGAQVAHIIAAIGVVLTSCLTAFLAHRRIKADAAAKDARLNSEARQRNILMKLDHLHSKVNGFGPRP